MPDLTLAELEELYSRGNLEHVGSLDLLDMQASATTKPCVGDNIILGSD